VPISPRGNVSSLIARHELAIVFGLSALTALWAYRIQSFQVFRYWDSDEYYLMAQQLAAGETVTAAAPYAFRLLVPWLAGTCCAANIQQAFLAINLLSGIALVLLLVIWLRRFVDNAAIRVLTAAACVLQWHAPVRFVFYYPAYVDPLFQALVVAALIAGERLLDRPSLAAATLYTVIVAAGTAVRETMLIVPACALIGAVINRGGARSWRISQAAGALAAGVAVYLLARAVVDPRGGYRFIDAVTLHLSHKPIESLLLAWFIAFGPVLAVVLYDWRATMAFLRQRADLAAMPLLYFVLAYIGGHDTERYLFWSAPVVYLLIAQSIERHQRLLSSAAVATVLIVGQLLAQRVLWPVPDPGSAVVALGDQGGVADRVFAVANRVFVINDFHWNLWSNFGSRPFHLVQLAFYLTVGAAILMLMHRRDAALRGATT